MANITELLNAAIAEGKRIQETPSGKAKKASTSENGVPKPSTWEFLVDTLVQAGVGAFLHLSDIIPIMQMRGWKTKSASKTGTYRTVHSSTYKACRDKRKGHIARADQWINRSLAKDGLYALRGDIPQELIEKHNAWIEAKEWSDQGDAPDPDGEQTPADGSTPEGSTPQASTEGDAANPAEQETDTEQAGEGDAPAPTEQEAETKQATETEQAAETETDAPAPQTETPAPQQGRRARRNRARK